MIAQWNGLTKSIICQRLFLWRGWTIGGDICHRKYLPNCAIKSVLAASRSGKIRRHMQPYVSLALWGAWDLEFREAQRMRPAI